MSKDETQFPDAVTLGPDADQAIVDQRIAEVRKAAEAETKSLDPLVHIVWLIRGHDMWHRSGGKVGHDLSGIETYVLSHVLRLPNGRSE